MRYSFLKIVWNDWPALAFSIAVPMTWIIHCSFPYLNRGTGPVPLWFPVGGTVICIVVLLWRIGRIHWFFAHGNSAVAVITDLRIVKDRGRLEFAFEVTGSRVRTWMPIHKTRAVLSLSPGDRVDVLFDSSKPTRAIVKCLYRQ